MATTPEPKKRKYRKKTTLSKSDPDYFAKVGKKGGKTTAKRHGSDYFRKIANISHQVRRENAAEARAAKLAK